jgi:hypothetical protein
MQNSAVEGLIVPAVMGLAVASVLSFWPSDGDKWTDRWWHAIWYGVDADQVSIDPKPPDCDFWYAPIGRKACTFKGRWPPSTLLRIS